MVPRLVEILLFAVRCASRRIAHVSWRLATIIRLIYYSHMTEYTILAPKDGLGDLKILGCRRAQELQTRLPGTAQRWVIALQQTLIARYRINSKRMACLQQLPPGEGGRRIRAPAI